MKNKSLILAGIGLGSALTIGALSMATANEATVITTTPTSFTVSTVEGVDKNIMFSRAAKPGMMHMMGRGEQGAMGVKFMGFFGGDEATKTAIENNDYSAFVTAWNADANKPSDRAVPTQEQFTKMVEMQKKHAAIEAALENNDYDGYVKATTPTREEFDSMVKQTATQKAIHDAIESQDYEAFRSATKDMPMFSDMTEEEFKNMKNPQKMMKVKINKTHGATR